VLIVFDHFFDHYSAHNHRLWDRYTKGFIKQEELKWKRMWLALLEYKIADEKLSRQMSLDFLEVLPTKKALFDGAYRVTHLFARERISDALSNQWFRKCAAPKN